MYLGSRPGMDEITNKNYNKLQREDSLSQLGKVLYIPLTFPMFRLFVKYFMQCLIDRVFIFKVHIL